MQEYELTVLIRADLEADLEQYLAPVRALVTDNGGKIVKEDNWGKKRLAYPIKKDNFAVYVGFETELPPSAPAKISNALNISDSVIRYLLVKTDEKERGKIKAAKDNASERERSKDQGEE